MAGNCAEAQRLLVQWAAARSSRVNKALRYNRRHEGPFARGIKSRKARPPGRFRPTTWAWSISTSSCPTRLRELKANAFPSPDEADAVRFTDDNGIILEVKAASSTVNEPIAAVVSTSEGHGGERRRDVGRIAVERPRDRRGAREITFGGGQTNRMELAAPEPGRDQAI